MANPETIEAAEALLERPCLRQPQDQRLAEALHSWCSYQLRADLQNSGAEN